MIYEKMTAADVDRIARLYMDYYNQHEDAAGHTKKPADGSARSSRSKIPSS